MSKKPLQVVFSFLILGLCLVACNPSQLTSTSVLPTDVVIAVAPSSTPIVMQPTFTVAATTTLSQTPTIAPTYTPTPTFTKAPIEATVPPGGEAFMLTTDQIYTPIATKPPRTPRPSRTPTPPAGGGVLALTPNQNPRLYLTGFRADADGGFTIPEPVNLENATYRLLSKNSRVWVRSLSRDGKLYQVYSEEIELDG